MTFSPRMVAILDACVIYPAPIRDLLLHLATLGLYTPKWTEIIHGEWIRNLLINRPDLTASQLQKTKDAMCKAFPDANVADFEPLIQTLKLPDPDDCHLLAAAICCQADIIVTANLKDFPTSTLAQHNIKAKHPDEFISNLIDLNPEKALSAFQAQVAFLKSPPRTMAQILDNLRKVEMRTTADKLAALI